MRIIAAILMLISLAGCQQEQSVLAARNLSGTVLIVNVPVGGTPTADNPSPRPEGGGLGTGFIVDENTIVTNNHVIAGGGTLRVFGYRDGKPYPARVIAADETADLAVIRLDDWDEFRENVDPAILPWGDSRSADVGDTVWSMGNPYGLTWTVAQGLISHKLRKTKEDGTYYMQTTTQIYPGNSGGPLLDEEGRVVAVNSAIFGKEGYFGMAIPSDYARKVVDDLIEHGRVRRAIMGITVGPSEDGHDIEIKGISADSPALAAGLLPGDAIRQVRTRVTNGRAIDIHSTDELISEISLLDPGDNVGLLLRRDGRDLSVSFPVRENAQASSAGNPG